MNYILIVIFLLFSCTNSTREFLEVKNALFVRWSGAIEVTQLNPHLKKKEKIITPVATIQHLFSLGFLDVNFNKNYDCVYYEILSKDVGNLIFTKNKTNATCPLYPKEETVIFKSLVKNFIFNFENQTLTIANDKDQFILKLNERIKTNSFGAHSRNVPLIVTSPIKTKNISKAQELIADGEICQKIGDECLIEFSKCDLCQNGFYPIIDNACPKSYTKICGNNDCGKLNMPACIRGYISTKFQLNYCINDSPIGFCDKEYRVMCINNRLICR